MTSLRTKDEKQQLSSATDGVLCQDKQDEDTATRCNKNSKISMEFTGLFVQRVSDGCIMLAITTTASTESANNLS